MTPPLPQEKIAEIIDTLKRDMQWCAEQGIPWNPHKGAGVGIVAYNRHCGVCALGAHALKVCVTGSSEYIEGNVMKAAQDFGVPMKFASDIYSYVMAPDNHYNSMLDQQAWEISRELRRFGECLNNAHKLYPQVGLRFAAPPVTKPGEY